MRSVEQGMLGLCSACAPLVLAPLVGLIVRYDPLLRERVVTARRLQPAPPATLRVTVVNELAHGAVTARARRARRARGPRRIVVAVALAAPTRASGELALGRRARARRRIVVAAALAAPTRASGAKRGRSDAEDHGAPKRRRAESRSALSQALAAEVFGPQLPCPARVLAEAGVLLAAQHARRRVDFAAAGSKLCVSGELRLRLTRYESAPARGDVLEVFFSRS
jgi:hypothetical protein